MSLDLKEQNFVDELEGLFFSHKDGPLFDLRKKFWESFLKKGLPQKNAEVFHQVRLRDLYLRTYQLPQKSHKNNKNVLEGVTDKEIVIAFVNGSFCEDASQLAYLPAGISASPLSKAQRIYSAFLANRFQKSLQEEENPFALINGALQQEGIFLYIQPKVCLEQPIRIIHLIDNAENSNFSIQPRVHIFSGRESNVKLIFEQKVTHQMVQDSSWVNFFVDFALEENAHLQWDHINLVNNALMWNFESFRATLKKDATLKTVAISNGNRTYRQDYRVLLTQENSQVSLYGLWDLNQTRQSHVNVLLEHLAPQCQSLQHFKGILSEVSRSSFEGKIYVDQKAQKTQAFQRNNNLILSDDAAAHSKPNLEIYADDVKASHGATVGQLNEDELFYLQSRGVPKELAKGLLIYGFAKEIIDQLICPLERNKVIDFFNSER